MARCTCALVSVQAKLRLASSRFSNRRSVRQRSLRRGNSGHFAGGAAFSISQSSGQAFTLSNYWVQFSPTRAVRAGNPTLVVAQPELSLDGVSFSREGPFQCTGAGVNATSLARNVNSGSFNTTGERWFKVTENIVGWQASEVQGRTIRVNGVVVTPGQTTLPQPVNGNAYYFHFSAGSRSWASWGFW